MNPFHTVFEAGWRDLPWLIVWLGPVILVVSYLVFRYSSEDRLKTLFGLGLIVGTFWTVFAGTFFFQSAQALHDFRSGQAQTIEGAITDFSPMPVGGHATESFTLNGVRFAYSNHEFHGPCFDRTAPVGGPIKNGLRVRVSRVGNCIMKLEVADASK